MNAHPARGTLTAVAATLCGVALLLTKPSASVTDVPAARAHHALVYDAGLARVLLIGGSTPRADETFEFFDDIWAFDGVRWTNLGPAGSRRSGRALAYDSKRRRVLAFGGFCACPEVPDRLFDDVLELSGVSWKPLGQIPGRPTADAGLVYDSRRDRAVLFGGSGRDATVYGDTREFDGSSWQTVTAPGPEPRRGFGMVYDDRRLQTVLFGGSIVSRRAVTDETWVYDGTAWTKAAGPGPSPRHSPGVTYDSKRGRVVLFGGATPDGPLQDTWAWDGGRWTKLADGGPPARVMGAMAYDAARDRVVLFGGRVRYPNDRNDTWEWDGERWREVIAAAR